MPTEQSTTAHDVSESDAPTTDGRTGPLVSVCIPTYNGGAYLRYAMESVLVQSLSDFELIVVDNHSTDDTPAIVDSFNDSRIRYIRHATTLPLEENWNFCLGIPSGRYFKLLPHDDQLEASCLADQVAAFEADKLEEIALVFGARRVIDHTGRQLMVRGRLAREPLRIDGCSLARRCIRAGSNLIGEPGNGLIRTSLIQRIGGYSTQNPYMTDLDFWFRALRYGDACFTGTTTSSFRVSAGSWSTAIGRAQYRDFSRFASAARQEPAFRITWIDQLVGLTRARINTLARLIIYRLIDLVR